MSADLGFGDRVSVSVQECSSSVFEVPGAIIVSAGADENGWRES